MTNMMRCAVVGAVALAGMLGMATLRADDKAPDASKPGPLNFTVKTIDGKDADLSQYAGKVVLIVNVASLCGNTPQYEGLEKMYAKYGDKGFVILGFPANNFGAQEPGTNSQILEFCKSTYDVKFPMFSKISVKGADIAPLYTYLTSLDTKPAAKGDITWNFEKFLVGRDGNVLARFTPKTKPEDPTVVSTVEAALAK